MQTIEIPTGDAVEMVRAIRNKHYEETKNMSPAERDEYYQKKVESFERRMQQVNPTDYDFSFLTQK